MDEARTMLLMYSLGVLLCFSVAQLAPSGAPIMISREGMRSLELPSLPAMLAAIDEVLVVAIDDAEPPCAALEAADPLLA